MAYRYTVPQNVSVKLEELSKNINDNSGLTFLQVDVKDVDENTPKYRDVIIDFPNLIEPKGNDDIPRLVLNTNNESFWPAACEILFNDVTDWTYAAPYGKAAQIQLKLDDNPRYTLVLTAGTRASSGSGIIQLGHDDDNTVNFIAGSSASAPSTTSAGTVTNRYGGASNFLGEPAGWIDIMVNGLGRKLPYY